jgi:uncharacterized protein (TIGR02444 family)
VPQGQTSFWTFSIALYNDPAVQRECLDLQDHYDVNVNLLLFCAFVGAVHGALLSRTEITRAESAVHVWHGHVVGGLRAARRALKSFGKDALAIGLYGSVKAHELEAEQFEQRMIERWGAEHSSGWPKASPSVAVEKNIATLFEVSVEEIPRPAMPNNLISCALRCAAKWQGGVCDQP